jgi:N-formylglutamate amidohydrolase
LPPPDDAAYREAAADLSLTPCDVLAPVEQTAPVVFASPHSGSLYPEDFIAASRLDPLTLRRSEDAFIDDVFGAAPERGAPLLRAHFPRAYVDPNREAFELDPGMFADPLPDYVNSASPRVAAGLGTIAKVVTNGERIYTGPLRFAEAKERIETCYTPYHAALKSLIERTRERFGGCLLVDCHSMPSVGGPMDRDPGAGRVDMVLGDCHGTACSAAVTDLAERALTALGFRVMRNTPYAGGFTTRHYGAPEKGVHALQIEINRACYMNETIIAPTAGLTRLTERIGRLIETLAAIDPKLLAPT